MRDVVEIVRTDRPREERPQALAVHSDGGHVRLRSGQSPAAWDGSRPWEERS